MKKLIYSFLFVFISVSLSAQSPWAQGKGGGYAQVAFQTIPEYSQFFGAEASDTITSIRPYTDAGFQLYGEYGIFNNTTLVLNVPFKMLSSGAPTDGNTLAPGSEGTYSGLGNLALAVKQQLLNDPLALGVSVEAEFPTSSYDETTGLRTGYDALSIKPMVSVGMGRSKFYAYARAGMALRGNDYSNHFLGGVEAGYQFFNRLWIMLDADAYISQENGTYAAPFPNDKTLFYVNDQEWVAFSAKMLLNITEKLGVTASSTIGIIDAQYVPRSPHLSVGVFYDWNAKAIVIEE